MSDQEFLSTPIPSTSPVPFSHCDYSDWSPSFSIIPSIYLLAFLVGFLGNGLVLWAFLYRADVKTRSARQQIGFLKCICGRNVTASQQNVRGIDRSDGATFMQKRKTSCQSHRPSSQSCPPSLPRSSRSLTDSLIANLALADMCFLVTLPLWAVYTAMGYHWPFGQSLCQISSFLTALNMYASVFSLSMLSVERYWVLTGRRHSSQFVHQSCPNRTAWILGGVWVVAGVLALPGLLLRSVREVEQGQSPDDEWQPAPTQSGDPSAIFLSCLMDYSMLIEEELDGTEREQAELWWAAVLSLKSTLIGFLLPLIILLVCYCSLAHLLSKHFGQGPHPDRRRQRRLLRVIVSLVLAFFLCWLPLHINKTVSMLLEFGFVPYSCYLDQILLAAHPYVTCLAYLNSCLNPLLYAACDSSFRKRCKGVLIQFCRGNRRGPERMEAKMERRWGELEDPSPPFPTRTQEETADRTEEERTGDLDGAEE